jgi:hypothetical protein
MCAAGSAPADHLVDGLGLRSGPGGTSEHDHQPFGATRTDCPAGDDARLRASRSSEAALSDPGCALVHVCRPRTECRLSPSAARSRRADRPRRPVVRRWRASITDGLRPQLVQPVLSGTYWLCSRHRAIGRRGPRGHGSRICCAPTPHPELRADTPVLSAPRSDDPVSPVAHRCAQVLARGVLG